MSVYDEILEKKKQDRIRYELEQRREEIKELDKEIERLHSIIKEAREHIELYTNRLLNQDIAITPIETRYLLEILDKVGSDKE